MRILYFGDIVGRAARQRVCERLPELRRELDLEFVLVNGENAAGGFGITPEICEDLLSAGADVVLTGNHVWDQRDIIEHFDGEPRLIRPANFPPGTPGRGAGMFEAQGGRRVLVVQVMGRIFMDPLNDPFECVEREIAGVALGTDADCIVVDMHGEATSEKMAFAHFLDGRVSMVAGTHTHVPTADIQILPGGTAYQSDVGMCGDFDSVIGMDKEEPLRRFIRKIPGGRFTAAMGEPTLCGLIVETDDATGLALSAQALREGGRLEPAWPSFAARAPARSAVGD